MTARKSASGQKLRSDLARVDRHVIKATEYDDLPELTADMLERGKINKGGRPRSDNPKRLITLRLAEDVINRWRATGPGWQTRMAKRLAAPPRTRE